MRLGFETILVAASRRAGATEAGRLARELEQRGLPLVEADDRAFDAVSPVRSPSGIAAIALRTAAEPTSLCERPQAFVLVIADVQDPGNLGAIVRVAEAGGATGVAVVGRSADPFGWKALRGSMGSALRLPIATLDDPVTLVTDADTYARLAPRLDELVREFDLITHVRKA